MYTNLGNLPVIVAADLLDLQSSANKLGSGNSRIGSSPYVLGKRPGMLAWRDAGSGALSLVFCLGALSSSAWELADGSATYTPTNLGSFTDGADTDYADGLLTTDGGDDAAGRTAQSLTLSAGVYIVSGTAAIEGDDEAHTAPRIRIGTSAAGTQIASKVVGRGAADESAAEDATPKDTFQFKITVASTATIHFVLDVVDEDDAIAAGSAFITLNPLESTN